MPLIIDLTSSDPIEPTLAAIPIVDLTLQENDGMDTDKAFLLTVPTEIRCEVYKFLIDIKGTLAIYSQYEIAQQVDSQTLTLMHVNHLLREEVQEYFYKEQKFQFRSTSAVHNFIKRIGRYHASIIKNIEFTQWMCRRLTGEAIATIFEQLVGIEQLTVINPLWYSWIKTRNGDVVTGDMTDVILRSSEKLAAGKIFLKHRNRRCWDDDERELLFVSKHVVYPPSMPLKHINGDQQAEVTLTDNTIEYQEILSPDKIVIGRPGLNASTTEEDATANTITHIPSEQEVRTDEADNVSLCGRLRKKRRRTRY
ncbi:hypothetical protein H2198_005366 [Neophaeococcomyces mojaviensis]|uniref:Uncharacterized protein n=1 Tax=Neophaeococcomyces mojaviensis TaxID=3383035 RepID=A0ACC3A6B0_9EURO|nr:hypothetical protein H2198_005366 [Knufia sp. JES_112]